MATKRSKIQKIRIKDADLNIFRRYKFDNTIKMCMLGKSESGKTTLLKYLLSKILYKEYKFMYLLTTSPYVNNPYVGFIPDEHTFVCSKERALEDIDTYLTNILDYAYYLHNSDKIKDKIPLKYKKILVICDDLEEYGAKSKLINSIFTSQRHVGIGIIKLGQRYTHFSKTARENSQIFTLSSIDGINDFIDKTYKSIFPPNEIIDFAMKMYNNETRNITHNMILDLTNLGEDRISIISKEKTYSVDPIIHKIYSKSRYAMINKCDECKDKDICSHNFDNNTHNISYRRR